MALSLSVIGVLLEQKISKSYSKLSVNRVDRVLSIGDGIAGICGLNLSLSPRDNALGESLCPAKGESLLVKGKVKKSYCPWLSRHPALFTKRRSKKPFWALRSPKGEIKKPFAF